MYPQIICWNWLIILLILLICCPYCTLKQLTCFDPEYSFGAISHPAIRRPGLWQSDLASNNHDLPLTVSHYNHFKVHYHSVFTLFCQILLTSNISAAFMIITSHWHACVLKHSGQSAPQSGCSAPPLAAQIFMGIQMCVSRSAAPLFHSGNNARPRPTVLAPPV